MSKLFVKSYSLGRGDAAANVTGQGRLPSLRARMKARRSQLGLTGAELAHRAGISPSYVSLIESGAKTPDEGVAAALARALEDDEALYRAWARAARLGLHDLDLLNQIEVISRAPAYVDLVESGEELPKLDPQGARSADEATLLAARLQEVASRLKFPPASPEPRVEPPGAFVGPPVARPAGDAEAVARIPILPEGADPDASAMASPSPTGDWLQVDRRLLGGLEAERLFGYELTPRDLKHLRGLAAPGDLVLFCRSGTLVPDRICAVRTAQGIVLARVLRKGRSLLLLPGEGGRDFDSLEVPDPNGLERVLVGTQVLLIRR